MKKILKLLTAALTLMLLPMVLYPQFTDHKALSLRLANLVREHPDLCNIKSLGKTDRGRDIWLMTIGIGNKDEKPAIAIVGGIEGDDLTGRELSAGFAATLLRHASDPQISDLLGKITFYIFPDVSPDASEQFFSSKKYERNVNSRPTDDDRDFKVDEDPCEDMNNDGYISLIRIEDPSGTYIESNEDRRIMVKADLSKGETGRYLVYSEGIDNDKDGRFNEDGEGGICFNRNFTYNYEEFGLYSGPHPVSETGSRAVADFLFDHFNIFAVVSFSPQANLLHASDLHESTNRNGNEQHDTPEQESERIITSVLRSDAVINKLVSERYREITGALDSPPVVQANGNFAEWAYFHYGRYSFSTPGWWFPVEKNENPEAAYLKFADKKGLKDVFIPWTEVAHPDFPGKKAEVGGIRPFMMKTPPCDTLETLINAHYEFITSVAAMHSGLEFLDVEAENLGKDIFRISLKVHNKGILATCAEIGERSIWTRVMRLSLLPSKGQSVISGFKVQNIKRLNGNESAEFSWLVSGKGEIEILAGALNTGMINRKIELR